MVLENPSISLVVPSSSRMILTLILMPTMLISSSAQMRKTEEVERHRRDKKLVRKQGRLTRRFATQSEITSRA